MKPKSLTNLPLLGLTLFSNTGALAQEVFSGNPSKSLNFFLLLIGIAAWAVVSPDAWSADAPQRIRIAYASRSNSATPQYVAQDKGFFKAEGLEVELIQMNPRLGANGGRQWRRYFCHAFCEYVSRNGPRLADETRVRSSEEGSLFPHGPERN
jgi:NMT1/THI5 like